MEGLLSTRNNALLTTVASNTTRIAMGCTVAHMVTSVTLPVAAFSKQCTRSSEQCTHMFWQAKEVGARAEFLRSEREKLLKASVADCVYLVVHQTCGSAHAVCMVGGNQPCVQIGLSVSRLNHTHVWWADITTVTLQCIMRWPHIGVCGVCMVLAHRCSQLSRRATRPCVRSWHQRRLPWLHQRQPVATPGAT